MIAQEVTLPENSFAMAWAINIEAIIASPPTAMTTSTLCAATVDNLVWPALEVRPEDKYPIATMAAVPMGAVILAIVLTLVTRRRSP